MAKILLIYPYYLRKNDPGFSRYNEYLIRWVNQGHKIDVITSQVNYLTGIKNTKYKTKWVSIEKEHRNIKVFRVYTTESYSKSFFVCGHKQRL